MGGLFLGVILLIAAYYLYPSGYDSDPMPWMFAMFAGFLGTIALLGSAVGFMRLQKIRQQREDALKPSGTFGEADFASVAECEAAGLMNPRGLYLGVLDGRPLFYTGKAHLLTVAPARQGKGIAFVIPNLLHWQGSVFVTDPKGELAGVTERHRREHFGQEVFVLNPWGLHNLPQHRYNPFQPLIEAASDPALIRGIADEAKALALQLLPEPEDGARNRYFREGSRKILRALMLHFATRGEPENCNLTQIWRVLNNVSRLKETIVAMAGSTALNGTVADLGDDLSYLIADNEDQFADFREGALQVVDIFDPVGWLGDAVAASDFDFRALKEGKASVYLVIPQDRIATHGAWLGLVTRQAISAVARSGGNSPVLFLLDEFANMGKLAGLAESLTALPGLGVRVWAIVQELSDLRRVYGPHTTDTILSQAEVKQFFAVQNDNLARTLSAALGERTVKTKNYNLGRDDMTEVSESLGETGRPLLTADEIRQMPADQQLMFVKALPPIRANRIPFWNVSPWNEWADPNPVEGTHPPGLPYIKLNYRRKG